MLRIDLNCDLGEGAGYDAELLPLVTSANLACGGHAGDETTMRQAVALAQAHGVAIGAHPGFPDRENFGRRELVLAPPEIFALVLSQVRALQHVAHELGAVVRHVKPHGALYNLAARDAAVARAIAEAVRAAGPGLVLFGLAGSVSLAAGRACGLRVAAEAFADRTYQTDGSLTPRSRPDALLSDETAVVEQVLRIVREGAVRAVDGNEVRLAAETICLHGDGVHALALARRLHAGLRAADVELRAVTA